MNNLLKTLLFGLIVFLSCKVSSNNFLSNKDGKMWGIYNYRNKNYQDTLRLFYKFYDNAKYKIYNYDIRGKLIEWIPPYDVNYNYDWSIRKDTILKIEGVEYWMKKLNQNQIILVNPSNKGDSLFLIMVK